MTSIDEYLKYQLEAEEKYGKNTVVFYENGSFYELYGVDNDKEKVGQPKRVSEILNIAITRKNKKILENSRKNPLLVGVPVAHADKHIKSLIGNGFTIVFVEQTTKPPNPDRALTHVLSPTTYITDEYRSDNNYVLSIYLEMVKNNLGAGMCAYDLTTGDGVFYQTILSVKEVVLEEIYRFMEAIDPKEIVINVDNCDGISFAEIRDYLELYRHQYYLRGLKQDYFKLSYQNQLLTKIFPGESLLTPIERLNLEFQQLSTMSLMLALDFIFDHDERILRSLNPPREWEEKKHLILNNNTLYQLNIVCDNSQSNSKSLFDIINQTKTIMGKRLLKNWMLNPIICARTLNQKYNILERVINEELWKVYDKDLSMILDLERFFRKMSIGYLLPHELSSFEPSLDAIKNIIKLSESHFDIVDNNFVDIFRLDDNEKEEFEQFYNKYFSTFDLNLLGTFGLNDINQSFFITGVEPHLDEIQNLIKKERDFFEKEAEKYSKLIDIPDSIKFDHNERDGYFLKTTAKRGELLEKKLGKGTTKNSGANICRIIHPELDNANDRLKKAEIDIRDKVRDTFINWCEKEFKNNQELFSKIIKFIGTIDMTISSAKVCKQNCYNKPTIVIKENRSFLKAKELRHPIIEKINQDILYIPNDIEINGDGILLYGLNGGGKSSLLKSVGLATVMAQMGLYVPAETFEYYPFKTLYTRIMGNDNIFRGLSSFALEMTELKTILQYANERSLILGDEICRGTEIHSALSIVSSAVWVLCNKRTNFLFATHLHKLHEIEVIKGLPNLRHFYIDLNMENDRLVFGRKIYEGIGRKLYGLEVAEHIVEHNEFLKMASKVRRQLLEGEEVKTEIISTKKSIYNSEIYMDKCEICDSADTLEVHHINSQKFADCDNNIDFFNKNHKGNLVTLCHDHHTKVHTGDVILGGWKDTLKGKVLDWKEKETVKVHKSERKNSLSDEIKERVKSYKYLLKNIGIKILKSKIEKDLNIKITLKQIKDIFEEPIEL